MNKEIDDMEQLLREISLDVKLAFRRVMISIMTLKDDIGEEAAANLLRRIRNDIERVLQAKRDVDKVVKKE